MDHILSKQGSRALLREESLLPGLWVSFVEEGEGTK